EAIRRRRLDLHLLNRLIQLLSLSMSHARNIRAVGHARFFTDLTRLSEAHAAEILLEKRPELRRLRALKHLKQGAEFNALGVRLDFLGFLGKFLDRPGKLNRLVAGRDVRDRSV